MEVLQELRVAITGGQILFGFLLTVPFAQRWKDTDDFQRTLFLITLLVDRRRHGLLHRPDRRPPGALPPARPPVPGLLRQRRRDRRPLLLPIAMVSAVLLVTDFVFSRTTAIFAVRRRRGGDAHPVVRRAAVALRPRLSGEAVSRGGAAGSGGRGGRGGGDGVEGRRPG